MKKLVDNDTFCIIDNINPVSKQHNCMYIQYRSSTAQLHTKLMVLMPLKKTHCTSNDLSMI